MSASGECRAHDRILKREQGGKLAGKAEEACQAASSELPWHYEVSIDFSFVQAGCFCGYREPVLVFEMTLKSWLTIPVRSHFSLANLPFGIISQSTNPTRRCAVAVGDFALDLHSFSMRRGFSELHSIQLPAGVFSKPFLNDFAALGRSVHREVRMYLQDVLKDDTSYPQLLKTNRDLQEHCLFPLEDVQMHVPLAIGDYTDFYAGRNHAYNAGVLFRGLNNALQPNYTHLPVGYHGRASSVVVSGTPIRRPWGQILDDPGAEPKKPVMSPSRKLDMELELGAFVCKTNKMGEPIPVDEAEEYLFGVVLLNDWSARDIQAWEAVPLGPFGAKKFGTTISPWVVLADALESFMVQGLQNETELQPYLREKRRENVYDINLQVDLTSEYPPSSRVMFLLQFSRTWISRATVSALIGLDEFATSSFRLFAGG